MEKYAKILRNQGCVTENQFHEVISDIKSEISRRKSIGADSLKRREEIRRTYVPLRKEVYSLQENCLDPEFLRIVTEARKENSNKEQVCSLLDGLGEEVYRFPVFRKDFCRLLLEELEHIERSDCPKGRPNTMNTHGILLNEFGFDESLLNPLRENYLKPITSILFPSFGGHCLDSHKAFTVLYEANGDLALSCHFDNAEITLNIALGSDFSGGDLYFLGMKDENGATPPKKIQCQHFPGWGVLHRGYHMHGAEPITAGRRSNLIMWMRASSVRNIQCPMCDCPPHLVAVVGADDGFRVQDSPLAKPKVVDVCHVE